MRMLRSLVVVVVVASNVLGWGLSPALVSGAAPAASPAAPAAAFTINVATSADIDPNAGPGPCSLRGALQLLYSLANGACGSTVPPAGSNVTIVLPPMVQLSLPSELPAVYNGDVVNITGPVVIDGGSQSNNRHGGLFHVVNGTLNLKNLTLRHGSRAAGGAIWLGSGAVIADNVRFDSNDAAVDQVSADTGGAIMGDTGDLTVTNSTFVNNLANLSGGAVSSNFGYFDNDKFIGNRASDGGAFSVRSTTSAPVVITGSQFKGNLAEPQAYQVPQNSYQPNGDLYGGGAIHNLGFISVTKTLFQNNLAALTKGGGAIWNQGQAVMNECVFTQNKAMAQSAGSNPYNGNIASAWGGAIINYGDLMLVRCSIHDNTADYAGAIFNHGNANLQMFNSTVSNNTSTQIAAPIMNEHYLFDNTNSSGAQIHLVHDTIDPNPSSVTAVDARDLRSVWFSNSLLAGTCTGIQYTVGYSVMEGVCRTGQDPNTVPPGGADITATGEMSLALHSLVNGNSTVPEFKVQPIDSSSVAVGIGRDDAYGCGNAAVNHLDQNLVARPGGACDAGALQAAAVPPHFVSYPIKAGVSPKPGIITFTVDYFLGIYDFADVTLYLQNTGGGAITYEVIDEGGDGEITLTNAAQAQGTIAKAVVPLHFHCAKPAAGKVYRRDIRIQTTAPNQPQADYQLDCIAVDQYGMPAMLQKPGPYNMPDTELAQTVDAGFDVTNPGHATLTLDPALANTVSPWGPLTTSAPAGQAPASTATTLNPGQSLHVDVSCTPNGPGVFLNTLTFTTSDPRNPLIQYNLACDAQAPATPEALQTASAYNPSTGDHAYGVAVSPDGAQVLAGGGGGEVTLTSFVRDPSTGALSQNGWVALPGMSAIQSVHYSHDGQYVYYTSAEGNGLVAIQDTGDSLGASQVITPGTTYPCFVNHFITNCPIGAMYGADGLAVSPDDQFVYVVGYYDNSLTTFQRQPNGQLAFFQTITGTQTITQTGNGLSGPVKVAVSPDGNNVYVASFSSSTVASFQRTDTSALSFQTAYQNGLGGLANLGAPSDLAVSPDGGFLYVAASASNAMDVFQRDSATGGLSLSSVLTGVTGAWGVGITHDGAGRRLFLTTQTATNQVRVYGRDQSTGALSFVGANTVTDPVFVTSSPDDLDVYASLYSAKALQHFQTVRNVPVLSHISPASALMGGSGFTLTVSGARFYPDSQVVWNAFSPATTYISQNELQAQVPAAYISAQTPSVVTVLNSGPGGGFSNSLPFTITTLAQPPVPSIASLDPPAASFGGGDLVVLVHGANFAPNAQVSYNHVSVPTLFLNANLLQITLSADILNAPGDGGLEVSNGGGAPALSAPAALAAATTSSSSTVVSFRVNPPGVPAAPDLASLSPASVVSGSAAVWVTVTGYNFSAGAPAQSVGQWNGSVRPSVVIDAHTLLMGLTRADLATAGYGQVTVQTPGYGTSTPLVFRVRLHNENPIPVVASDGLRGGTLAVFGSDFVSGAQAYVNGSPRATTFVNAYELTTVVTQADHGVVISVSNPGPGGGMSNLLIGFLAHLFLPLVRR